MKIVTSLASVPRLNNAVCTMGNFDGMHLGHQHLLQEIRKVSNGPIALLTFANHPLEIVRPSSVPKLICSLERKLQFLENAAVDVVVVLEFTTSLSQKTYQEFLEDVKKHIPFSKWVLGKGAAFGKGKEGNEENLKACGHLMSFEAHYIPPLFIGSSPVSSGRVREEIKQGNLEEVKKLLGRPYSIYANFKDQGPLKKLQLPPEGTYQVRSNKGPFALKVSSSFPFIEVPPHHLMEQSQEIVFL